MKHCNDGFSLILLSKYLYYIIIIIIYVIVRFRFVVFHPFIDEVIVGRIRSSSADGVKGTFIIIIIKS